MKSWQLMKTHFIASVFLPIPATSPWDCRAVVFKSRALTTEKRSGLKKAIPASLFGAWLGQAVPWSLAVTMRVSSCGMLPTGPFDFVLLTWPPKSHLSMCAMTSSRLGTGVDDFKLMDVMLEGQSINDYQMERSRVFLWDARTGREVTQLTGHREKVNSVRFVNGGTQVVSCSGGLLHGSEHSVFVWDLASGSLITNLGKQATAVVGSCADSDGQAFFTVCWDGAVQAWDGGRVLNFRPIVSHEQEIRIIEFSPDGRRVVTTSWDDPPRIWDVDSGRHIATLDGHACLIRTAWFSPDSRLILTGAGRKYPKEPMDYTARLWDVETGRCRGILEGHTSPVTLAKFSMDGKFIVTGESDVRSMVARPHTIRVWDSRTLKQIAKFGRGQPEFMISLASGDNPEHLIGELERMGIHLPPPKDAHLLADVHGSTETRVRLFKKPLRRGEEPIADGVILGWVPDIPNSSTITPFALHSESVSFAIAHAHDLRLFRIEGA